MDENRVEELVGAIAGHMTGGAVCFAIWLGDELGIYQAHGGLRRGQRRRGGSEDGAATRDSCVSGSMARRPRDWSPTTPPPTGTS